MHMEHRNLNKPRAWRFVCFLFYMNSCLEFTMMAFYQTFTLFSQFHLKMEDTHSPVPATTAEEAMVSSRQARASSLETGVSGGAVPLGGAMAAAEADGREESGRDSEAWAAAVPPVRTLVMMSLPLQSLYSLSTSSCFSCSVVTFILHRRLQTCSSLSVFR